MVETGSGTQRSPAMRILIGIVSLVLPVIVILGGLMVARWMMETGPEAKRKKPKRRARLVQVIAAESKDVRTTVDAMGTVRAAREIVLRSRVTGEVVEVSARFIPGGRFDTGEPILTIDARDYELAVERRETELSSARADFDLEKGNQEIARREFELLGEEIAEEDRALVLREPQLAKARAQVGQAETALAEAELALQRTRIVAPFPCLVRERNVNLGAQVTSSTALATLLGTGELWVEASIPVDRLIWIDLPKIAGQNGSAATVIDPTGQTHSATVLSLTGELEPQGRMARILIGVSEPPAGDGSGLIPGAYVRVKINGRPLTNVIPIPSRFIRDGDTVWLMSADGKLSIRPINIAFRERDVVYADEGLAAGERVVTSDLSTPVPGMPLRLNGDEAPAEGTPK